jgi:O-antigen/teichoic acid export membrane protein
LFVIRALSQVDWGAYTLVISLTSILDMLVSFQLGRMIVVELASGSVDAGRTMGSLLTLRLCLSAAGYGVALAIVALGPYPSSLLPAMAVGGLNLVFGSVLDGLSVYQQLLLHVRPVALVLVASRLAFVVLVLALFLAGSASLLLYVLATLAATALPLAALAVFVRRSLVLRPAVEPARWRRWLADSLPVALGFAIGTLYFRIDVILLSLLDSVRAVGLYGVGYKLGDVLLAMSSGLLGILFALLVRGWPAHPALFWRNWRGAFVLSTIVAVGASTGFGVFAAPAVATLFGSDYEQAAGAARIVVIGCALHFFTALLVTTLVVVGRTRVYVQAALLGLAMNVAINLVVIPRYSYVGAAWATLATEGAVLVVLARGVWQIPGFPAPPWPVVGRSLSAAAALAAAGVTLEPLLPWPVAAAVAAVVFGGVLHVLGVDGPGGLRVLPRLLSEDGLPGLDRPTPLPTLPS